MKPRAQRKTAVALVATAVVDVAIALRTQRREWQRLLKPLLLPVGVVIVREQREQRLYYLGVQYPWVLGN